jgi:hypothetical protein
MSAHSAVCVRCGTFKQAALIKCESCGFVPSSPEDHARSLMLSRQFDVGEDVVGLQPQELQAVSARIQGGHSYQFDPEVLARVMGLHNAARAVSPRRLVVDLVRWLWLPIILLAGVYWLLWRG